MYFPFDPPPPPLWKDLVLAIPGAVTAVAALWGVFIAWSGLSTWQREALGRRRIELAEDVLADFYKARSIFEVARLPFVFSGEGATRPRQLGETEIDTSDKDAIYAPLERLAEERAFLSALSAKRFRFMALFGNTTEAQFDAFVRAQTLMINATSTLLSSQRIDNAYRVRLEGYLGFGDAESDDIKEQIDTAVAKVESICRGAIQVRSA